MEKRFEHLLHDKEGLKKTLERTGERITVERIKKLFQATDMTVGEPWKQIVLFTIPMLIGNIAQQLYNTVDSIVVGRYVGDNALAAVGSAGPILNLLLVLFVGISMGASIMVAQYFGAKERENLSYTIGNCIFLTAGSVIDHYAAGGGGSEAPSGAA